MNKIDEINQELKLLEIQITTDEQKLESLKCLQQLLTKSIHNQKIRKNILLHDRHHFQGEQKNRRTIYTIIGIYFTLIAAVILLLSCYN